MKKKIYLAVAVTALSVGFVLSGVSSTKVNSIAELKASAMAFNGCDSTTWDSWCFDTFGCDSSNPDYPKNCFYPYMEDRGF